MSGAEARSGSDRFISINDLYVAREFVPLLRANGLDCMDGLFRVAEADTLGKPGLERWRQRLRVPLRDGDRACTLYLKRYTQPPAYARRKAGRGFPARSVAGREWEALRTCQDANIACPEPVAFGEEFDGGREVRSAVLTLSVPGESLERWCAMPDRPRRDVRGLIPAVAEFIARLHTHGLVHRDLYLAHVFFDPQGQATGHDSLHLIDLQRITRPAMFMRRWLVKDLAALNYSAPTGVVTRTDRLRWLRAYLGQSRLDASARRLAFRVIGRTARIARHDSRRIRRLAIEGDGA